MSKSKWGRKLLTILNSVGTLFKRKKVPKQGAIAKRGGEAPIAKRISRIKLKKINNRRIFWAELPVALVVVIAGSIVSKAGAIFPESIKVGRQPDGSVLVNTGQFIIPAGKQIEFNGRPVAVTLSPDGKTAAFLNGVGSSQGKFIAMSKVQKAWFEASTMMFNKQGLVPDEQDENLLNRAIWYGTRGFNKPYPGDAKVLLPEEVTGKLKL